MKKTIKQILTLLILIIILILPYFVFAGGPLNTLETVGTGGGYADADETSAASIAGTAVSIFLSILGIIFLILTLYGGYLWMTARGNEEQVTKAKSVLTRAIIGLIIVISAYAITSFANNAMGLYDN